ncbi:MAG: transposase [Acidobacteriota bacterium]|nr:transposase [Acidobacteriota bacterium]
MWNDTDTPLAYLITFRCYGTWLHGDERGSVNRFRNQYKTSHLPPEKHWTEINSRRLKGETVTLNAAQRICVEEAIRETCSIRGWHLRAINVRTNHVHTVVSIGENKPESALNAFKANAARKMREKQCWQNAKSPWADKGSKRYLWNERSIELAIDYVINGQGVDLPDFD